MTSASANALASALAAMDSQSPSPWNDLAAAQASAQTALTNATASAQLALSQALADALETAEQAQDAATQANDDAQSQAQDSFNNAAAQVAHDDAVAQVFNIGQQLPNPLIPPDDGPAPTLTPDFMWGYEANDFYVGQTTGTFLQASIEMGIGWVWFRGVPNYAGALSTGAYLGAFWSEYAAQLNSYLGDAPGEWGPPNYGTTGDLAGSSAAGAGGTVYGNPIEFTPRDMVRGGILPLPAIYQNPMHLTVGDVALPSWWGLSKGSRVPPPPVPGNFAGEMRLLAHVTTAEGESVTSSQGGTDTTSQGVSVTSTQSGRKWDPETVQEILELLDPQFADWWGSHIGYNGARSEGLPTIGNIQSSGSDWFHGDFPWFYSGENGPSANVGSGAEGKQPLTVSVPDSWTSEQVAHYILKQAQPGGAFAQQYSYYLQGTGNVDKITQGGVLQRENIGKGVERATEIMIGYLEFIGSLNPVGGFIFSVRHLYKGDYVAGVLGLLSIMPWGKFAKYIRGVDDAHPPITMRFRGAGGAEDVAISSNAIEGLRGLKPAQQKVFIQRIKNAQSANEARSVLSELERLVPPGKPPLPPPRAEVRWKWSGHENAALAEEQLAREVHALPDQAVVDWGDAIGTHGADVVSVNISNGVDGGSVTLWDAKFRSSPVNVPPSATFAPGTQRLENAINKAIKALEDNKTLPQDVVNKAIANLQAERFTAKTIGYGQARGPDLVR